MIDMKITKQILPLFVMIESTEINAQVRPTKYRELIQGRLTPNY